MNIRHIKLIIVSRKLLNQGAIFPLCAFKDSEILDVCPFENILFR